MENQISVYDEARVQSGPDYIVSETGGIDFASEGHAEADRIDARGSTSERYLVEWPWRIELTRGYWTMVDEDNYEELTQWSWCVKISTHRNIYARRAYKINGHYKDVHMHQQIMKTNQMVDHVNGNGLDNRKQNLRLASQQQNSANMRKHHNKKSSQYKGVFRSRSGGWYAQVYCKGIRYNSSCVKTEVAAARDYDKKAKEWFGEFACLNFPNEAGANQTVTPQQPQPTQSSSDSQQDSNANTVATLPEKHYHEDVSCPEVYTT
jgi:hypothetical protein